MAKRTEKPVVRDAAAEFEGAFLPDARLAKRLRDFVRAAAVNPAASFPEMAKTDAALEGLYRFLSNEGVDFGELLEPHIAQSRDRALAATAVLVVHDTSAFKFEGSRGAELGYLNTGARGFYLHASIAVRREGRRECLGLLEATPVFREAKPKKKRKKKLSGGDYAGRAGRESARWWEHVAAVRKRLGKECDVIDVADAEADNYTLLSQMVGAGYRFVFRMARDRRARAGVNAPWERVESLVATAEAIAERDVPLSARGTARPPRQLKKYPPRDARVAKLSFAAMPLEIKRPPYLDEKFPSEIQLTAVRVYEVDAPPGTEPVEWVLFTTEPVKSREEVLAVVDIYRRRWLIEEYFRAVKTGCAYESRQLEGRHAWLNALAITLPLAWRTLQLRDLARREPELPATVILSETELAVLRHVRTELPAKPTLRQALLAIAGIGGHIKNNGEPGWLVLYRGMSEVQGLAKGVELADEMKRRPRRRM